MAFGDKNLAAESSLRIEIPFLTKKIWKKINFSLIYIRSKVLQQVRLTHEGEQVIGDEMMHGEPRRSTRGKI